MTAIELQGAYNVRDLGGLRTKDGRITRPGVIYRGDSLDNITPGDEKILFDKMARIGQLVYETGKHVANMDHPPARDNKGPRAGKGTQ